MIGHGNYIAVIPYTDVELIPEHSPSARSKKVVVVGIVERSILQGTSEDTPEEIDPSI